MGNQLKILVISLASAAGGFYIGYNLGKKKYQEIADIEVASVKKELEKRYSEKKTISNEVNESVKDNKPLDNERPPSIKKELGEYRDYSGRYSSGEQTERIVGVPKPIEKIVSKEDMENQGPYLISESEFAESFNETKTLYYFRDKVIADSDYNEILDVDDRIGEENLMHLGVLDRNYIYVRNDELSIDYEVLVDERYFAATAPRRNPQIDQD